MHGVPLLYLCKKTPEAVNIERTFARCGSDRRPSQEALFAAIVLGIVPLKKPFRKSYLPGRRISFSHA